MRLARVVTRVVVALSVLGECFCTLCSECGLEIHKYGVEKAKGAC